MTAIGNFLYVFWRDERAVTALEYGLIAGAVVVSIVTGVLGFSSGVGNLFNTAANAFTSP